MREVIQKRIAYKPPRGNVNPSGGFCVFAYIILSTCEPKRFDFFTQKDEHDS